MTAPKLDSTNAVVNGRLRVMSKRCAECLMSDGKIVSDRRRASLLRECQRKGTYFLCHKGTIAGEAIVCRGFYDTGSNQMCRIADRLGVVDFTEPGK